MERVINETVSNGNIHFSEVLLRELTLSSFLRVEYRIYSIQNDLIVKNIQSFRLAIYAVLQGTQLGLTEGPRSLDPFYIVTYYIK